jgi:hypothetical protein
VYSQDSTLASCTFDLTNINNLNLSIIQLSAIRTKTFYPSVNTDNFTTKFTDQFNSLDSFKNEPGNMAGFEINLYELYKTNFYNSNFNNINNKDIDTYLPNLKILDFDNYK